jgi:hypothetical protein
MALPKRTPILAITITIPVVLGARKEKFLLGLCMGQCPSRAATGAGFSAQYAPKLIKDVAMAGAIRECAANLNRTVAAIDRQNKIGRKNAPGD